MICEALGNGVQGRPNGAVESALCMERCMAKETSQLPRRHKSQSMSAHMYVSQSKVLWSSKWISSASGATLASDIAGQRNPCLQT